MPSRSSAKTGGELFIVDNSDDEWKALRYLREWCDYARSIDVATAYFEIGSLLGLDGQWQKIDGLRVLMGDEVAARTRQAFEQALRSRRERLDQSLEAEKEQDDFLVGVPAIVEAIRAGKIQFRVYRKSRFHAKAYITHARSEVNRASSRMRSACAQNADRPDVWPCLWRAHADRKRGKWLNFRRRQCDGCGNPNPAEKRTIGHIGIKELTA